MSDAIALAPRAAKVDLVGWWIAPPLIVLAVLFLYPLVLIAHAALFDDSGGLNLAAAFEVLNSGAFLNALLNTAEIAVASTAGCVILGLTLGLILAFAPFPGAGFVARVIDTFIALPTFLVTLAFTFLYGSAGILNGALTSGFLSSPTRPRRRSFPPGPYLSWRCPASRAGPPSICASKARLANI